MSGNTRYPPTERENERLFEAWRRARRRSMAADYGLDPEDARAVGVEFIARPHEMLPWEITWAKARGKVLARKFGW